MFVFSFAFLGFSAVLPRGRKAKELFHATILEMLEVQKSTSQSWQDTQLLLAGEEKTKTSSLEHHSVLNGSFLLCIKLISYNGNVYCREKAEGITRFPRGFHP